MKHVLIAIISIMLASHSHAEPAKPAGGTGYMLPKTNFRELLEITAKIANKPVVVSSEDDLKISTSLVLPPPISFENARKAIGALLLLEGYELVEEGDELHLRKILTKEQCDAMNQALGRTRQEAPEKLPLRRVPAGRAGEQPKEWILIRPEKK